MTQTWTINLWGSHPDDDNDDCWTGIDASSQAEAEAWLSNQSDAAECWIERVYPDSVERINPPTKQSQPAWACSDYAMEMGMGLGCDAYNDAMGY